mmetsp:Transcript_11832/g.34738  ORF Transcript_11832/g.34738 Transcript_11832/m.34738 type:complete len:229 (+) Transcript_11832:1307-1993(+)
MALPWLIAPRGLIPEETHVFPTLLPLSGNSASSKFVMTGSLVVADPASPPLSKSLSPIFELVGDAGGSSTGKTDPTPAPRGTGTNAVPPVGVVTVTSCPGRLPRGTVTIIVPPPSVYIATEPGERGVRVVLVAPTPALGGLPTVDCSLQPFSLPSIRRNTTTLSGLMCPTINPPISVLVLYSIANPSPSNLGFISSTTAAILASTSAFLASMVVAIATVLARRTARER